MMNTPVKRNILLNPGPATTTDTVKYAQVVPDICPREKEFGNVMRALSADLVRVVHGDPEKFTAVLFCGSGTINIDACISSLTPPDKKILIVNNGSYSDRGREVCDAYHMEYENLLLPYDKPASPQALEQALAAHPEVGVVYACHHETGTGVLNPIRELGAVAHRHGCVFIVDTTSSYAMLPIHMEEDNLDFIMASAQKGLMAMTGLSFVIGRTEILEASRHYPTRSYYTNLYMQYAFLRDKGEMHSPRRCNHLCPPYRGMKEYCRREKRPSMPVTERYTRCSGRAWRSWASAPLPAGRTRPGWWSACFIPMIRRGTLRKSTTIAMPEGIPFTRANWRARVHSACAPWVHCSPRMPGISWRYSGKLWRILACARPCIIVREERRAVCRRE